MLNSKFKLVARALLLFFLAFSLQPSAFPQVSRISALLTITNAPTTNGQTLTVNSSTRTWTNNTALNPAIYIQTNATVNGSATNLFLHLAQYRFTSSLNVSYADTNALKLQAAVNQPLSVSAGGSWASVVLSTQLVSTPFTVPVRVPLDVEAPTNAATIANLTVRGLNDFATTRGWTNWFLDNPTFSGTFSLAGPQAFVPTVVHTNYTITTNDIYLAVNSRTNTVPLTLPSASSSSNQVWIIHDDGGGAATNNINLWPASGDRINGATNYDLTSNFEGALIISRGGTNFYVYATGLRAPSNVPRSAIAAGTAAHIVINDGSGNLSSEATLGATRFPALTGDVTTSAGSLSTTIAANSVALTTDTTGNYVADVAGTANEITSTHTPGEGSTATISLPAEIDLGGKTSLEIPNSAAPTTDATGELALDTTITDHRGLLQYHNNGTNYYAIAIPTADLGTTDGYVIKYNAAGDKFTMAADDTAAPAGGDAVTVNGSAANDAELTNSSTFVWALNTTPAPDEITGYPTNLADAQISASAAIARSKIAAGTAAHLVINDGSGNLTSEATLGAARFPALTGDVTTAGGSLATTIHVSTNAFAGATNTLTLPNGYALYETTTDCNVTNVGGVNASEAKWCVLTISNAAASAITLRTTSAQLRALGSGTTNALSIGAGKVGILSVFAYGTTFTNYATAAQQ